MDISDDILRARNVLLRQSNGTQVAEYMRQNNYGDQTPVATSLLKNDENRKIIISEQVQEALELINETTKTDRVEIPYFLTGTKLEDGTIRFDLIMISGGQRDGQIASFTEATVAKLNGFVTMNRTNPNAIVCYGHTHPPHGDFYNEFSIDDLGAYVNFKNNQEFGEVDTVGMVLVDGNYNFVDYNNNEFHKLPNAVREIEENQRYERLPSYSHERVRTNERLNQQDNPTTEVDYVQRFSEGWDNSFNDIAEKSGLDKNVIRQEIINQADALNNTLYRLKAQGKITEQQEADITSNFNVAFNQAFSDFGLQPLTVKDIDKLTFSRNYTQREVERGMTIEQIDQNLARTTAEHNRSKDNNNIQVPEGRFNSPDMFLDGIVQEGQEVFLSDEEIQTSAREIMVAEREFAQGKEQEDEVSRDG